MFECCRQDQKEAMICIDNNYGFNEFTNFYQSNHNFLYFTTKTSHVTGSTLNWGVVRLPILHTLTRDVLSSFVYVRIRNKMTENSCKLTEICFSYKIKELLNLYRSILALVGFKMHSAACVFLQSTRDNIHQYQFNKPIILSKKYVCSALFTTNIK